MDGDAETSVRINFGTKTTLGSLCLFSFVGAECRDYAFLLVVTDGDNLAFVLSRSHRLSRVGRLTLAEEASKWWQTHGSEWMWLGSHSEQWMRLQSDRSVDNGETVDTVLPEPQRCLAAGIEWHRQVALHVTQCAHDCKMRILRVLEWAKTSLWQQVDWVCGCVGVFAM